MKVFVLTYFFDTVLGGTQSGVIGVYGSRKKAAEEMKRRAEEIKLTRPENIWSDDFSFEYDDSICLGYPEDQNSPYAEEIYRWDITKEEVK